MDSAIPGETHREKFVRENPKKFPDGVDTKLYKIKHSFPRGRKNKRNDEDFDTEPDKLLEEIDSYQKKKPKKSTKKSKKE